MPPTARTALRKILDRVSTTPESRADWRLVRDKGMPEGLFALTPGPDFENPRSRPTAETLPLGETEHALWVSEDFGQIEWQLIEARAVLPGQYLAGPRGVASGAGGVGCLYLPEPRGGLPNRSVRVEITRRLSPQSEVDDIVLSLVSHGAHLDWRGAVVEFTGVPVERLSVDRKVRLCSLATWSGAAAALCAFDDVTRRHYGRLLRSRYPQSHPDRTAAYDGEHFVEGRALQPMVGQLDSEGLIESAVEPDQSPSGVLIGPAALPYEIEIVAGELKGRRLDKGTALLVCPATPGLFRHAQRKGWLDHIMDAGGSVLDVSLTKRLGAAGLLGLAGAANGTVYVTGGFGSSLQGHSSGFVLASVRTILSRLQLSH